MSGNRPLAQRSPMRRAYLVAQPWPWAGQATITNHSIIFQLCHKYPALLYSAVPGAAWSPVTGTCALQAHTVTPSDNSTEATSYQCHYTTGSTSQRHRAVSGVLHQGLLGPHSSAFSDCIARAPTRRTRRSPYVDLHTTTSSRNTLVKPAE